jgi:Cysteine-rich CWC
MAAAGEGAETCPECGARFHCGAAAGEDRCWCFDEPPAAAASPLGAGDRCLCPSCLARPPVQE